MRTASLLDTDLNSQNVNISRFQDGKDLCHTAMQLCDGSQLAYLRVHSVCVLMPHHNIPICMDER